MRQTHIRVVSLSLKVFASSSSICPMDERLRRRAPRDWNSTEVVRAWRRRG